ncbi:MAG TPA: glycoside hydrolase family 88 protein [Candidatus Saccharimonadales bacterium]|nr:glycoside hydrolase family 88 protein [Candidatus Saccharimonadales bacterium]
MRTLNDFRDRPPLTHLKRLTTKDGVIQHADFEVPDPSFGYSIDDNARALIVCLWHYQLYRDPAVLQLAEIYFDYLKRTEKDGGSFHNFLSYSARLLDAEGSEDSIGRAIWALGETVKLHPEESVRAEASAMMKRTSLKKHLEHAHIRAKAYIMLGLAAAGEVEEMKPWADLLVEAYQKENGRNWHWFEGLLCYANGALPHALAVAYEKTKDEKYLQIAQKSFDWLNRICRVEAIPSPVGQAGWYYRGREKALYDQQPVDTADMVLAALKLFEITGKEHYQELAVEWMNWYYGHNIKGLSLYNEATKGVYDALTPNFVNENQGAESIVTYLMAFLELSRVARQNTDA